MTRQGAQKWAPIVPYLVGFAVVLVVFYFKIVVSVYLGMRGGTYLLWYLPVAVIASLYTLRATVVVFLLIIASSVIFTHFVPGEHVPIHAFLLATFIFALQSGVLVFLLRLVKRQQVEQLKEIVALAQDSSQQERVLQELRDSERRKDEFISMAAHELKTPITSLKIFLHIAAKNTTDPLVSKHLARATTQVDRLTFLIQDMLDASRIQLKKLTLRRQAIKLDDFMDEFKEEFIVSSHKIVYKGDGGATIAMDPYRFHQILTNLLSNAIKYSNPGTTIRVGWNMGVQNITFCVADQGVGIPKAKLPHVFDRYYRVNEQATVSGIGLGLFIAVELVRLHGGRIWVKSQEKKGSTFYFTLPL